MLYLMYLYLPSPGRGTLGNEMEKRLKRASPPGDMLLGEGEPQQLRGCARALGAHSAGGEHIQEVD